MDNKAMLKTPENAFALEVMKHFGHSFESLAATLKETGCGIDFLIGKTENAAAGTGGMVDTESGVIQKIIIDYDPNYEYFLIWKKVGA